MFFVGSEEDRHYRPVHLKHSPSINSVPPGTDQAPLRISLNGAPLRTVDDMESEHTHGADVFEPAGDRIPAHSRLSPDWRPRQRVGQYSTRFDATGMRSADDVIVEFDPVGDLDNLLEDELSSDEAGDHGSLRHCLNPKPKNQSSNCDAFGQRRRPDNIMSNRLRGVIQDQRFLETALRPERGGSSGQVWKQCFWPGSH